jgi:hypothetical protein
MAKYVGTSKRLQCLGFWITEVRDQEEMLCCFLPAIQESTSLKELRMELPCGSGTSNLGLDNILAHTQSLQSLSLWASGQLEDLALAAARSGLKKNTSLRELKVELLQGATTFSSRFTSLHDHPHLRRLCLWGMWRI